MQDPDLQVEDSSVYTPSVPFSDPESSAVGTTLALLGATTGGYAAAKAIVSNRVALTAALRAAVAAVPKAQLAGIGARVGGNLLLAYAMQDVAAHSAEQAGMDRLDGRTMSALTIGSTAYAINAPIVLGAATEGAIVGGLQGSGVSWASKVPNLIKGGSRLAGGTTAAIGSLAGGAIVGNVVLNVMESGITIPSSTIPFVDGDIRIEGTPEVFRVFGATDEQVAEHLHDFTTIETPFGDIPNFDPVTSVIRATDAVTDLADVNIEEGRHGDELFAAASFTQETLSQRQGGAINIDEEEDSFVVRTTKDAVNKTIGGIGGIVVGTTEVLGHVGGGALDAVETVAGGALDIGSGFLGVFL
jgi:hypothetical protein